MSEITVEEVKAEELEVEEVKTEEVTAEEAKTDKVKKPKTKAQKAKKPSWFKGLKAEFKKIIWPDKKTLVKQTVAVIVCSLFLGAVIAIVDALVKYGIDFLVR